MPHRGKIDLIGHQGRWSIVGQHVAQRECLIRVANRRGEQYIGRAVVYSAPNRRVEEAYTLTVKSTMTHGIRNKVRLLEGIVG
jgi:hypothetical protein